MIASVVGLPSGSWKEFFLTLAGPLVGGLYGAASAHVLPSRQQGAASKLNLLLG